MIRFRVKYNVHSWGGLKILAPVLQWPVPKR